LDRDGFEMSTGSAVGHAHEFRPQACDQSVAEFRHQFGNVRQGKCNLICKFVISSRRKHIRVFINLNIAISALALRSEGD